MLFAIPAVRDYRLQPGNNGVFSYLGWMHPAFNWLEKCKDAAPASADEFRQTEAF